MLRVITPLLLSACVFVVQAQESPATEAGAIALGSSVHAGSAGDAQRKDLERPFCIRETGSRLVSRSDKGKRDCLNVPGRSYSQEDLRRTGASNTADALRMLDPAIH